MTVFLDTAVLMYAAGAEHSLREPCRDILRRVRSGVLPAVTSAEVVQEILHRFTGSARHDDGVRLARATLGMFGPVLSLDHAVLRRTCDLAGDHPGARARDLVHVATCLIHEIEAIVSPDTDFDAIGEVTRIAP